MIRNEEQQPLDHNIILVDALTDAGNSHKATDVEE